MDGAHPGSNLGSSASLYFRFQIFDIRSNEKGISPTLHGRYAYHAWSKSVTSLSHTQHAVNDGFHSVNYTGMRALPEPTKRRNCTETSHVEFTLFSRHRGIVDHFLTC